MDSSTARLKVLFSPVPLKSLWLALLLCTAGGSFAGELQGIRLNEGPNNTRVVLDLTAETQAKWGALNNPPRVYVDLDNTTRGGNLNNVAFDSRVIEKVRYASQGGNTYRVVVDLNTFIEPKVFTLPPYGNRGHRVVIDLPRDVTDDECSTNTEPHKDVVVVVDAGHGGEEPGAIGVNGQLEKHVALSIARSVRDTLQAQPGFRVLMTRDGDYEVALEARPALALRERAHLFVSVHADSFRNSRPRGASLYVLRPGVAQDEHEKWTQQNNNRADWIGGVSAWVNSKCFDNPSDYLFLNERAGDFVLESSVSIGRTVLREMSRVIELHPKSVDSKTGQLKVVDRGFVVLKSTQVPSVLVETGFLSNPHDAKLLATESHRKLVGESIAWGVYEYFCANPPWHTSLSQKQIECVSRPSLSTHRVNRGDTLSGIAQRYRVSLAALQRVNNLRNDRIHIGQELNIPNRD